MTAKDFVHSDLCNNKQKLILNDIKASKAEKELTNYTLSSSRQQQYASIIISEPGI